MTALIVLGVILGTTLIIVLLIIAMRNGIVRGKNAVERAWANVITQERYKVKVIPKLTKALSEYKEFEQDLQTKITELRTAMGKLSDKVVDVSALRKTEGLIQGPMSGVNVAVEAYPDLKTSDLYRSWMRELSEAESNVAAAIRIFNQNVESFNNSLEVFPSNMVNEWFNKETAVDTFTDTEAEAGLEYKPNFG